jgi:hypothetical protein
MMSAEGRLDQVSAAAQRHAETISRILSLPLELTPAERDRIEHICAEIVRLPDVLAPWLDTPAGLRQLVRQTSTYLDEAHRVFQDAQQRAGLDKGDSDLPRNRNARG